MANVPESVAPAALTAVARHATDAGADRATKQGYLRWLPSGGRLLDVGCGAGAFLDLARAAGLAAIGVDGDAAAVSSAAAAGHAVHHGEARVVLGELAARGERFDGAVLLHVIEHLQPAGALALLQAIARVLPAGAPLLIATPNIQNHIVWSQVFWLDPTHVRPYPRPLLEWLGEAAGFTVHASFDDPSTRPRRAAWRAAIARLRSLISGVDKSGPQDSVVVLHRTASRAAAGQQPLPGSDV